MKTQLSKLLIFSLFVIALGSCKKDAEMPKGEIVNLKANTATEITAVSAVVSAKAEANCTERGVCWGKSSNPTIDDFHVANGSGKGEYACTLTYLEPGQKYYYRAYGFDGKRYAYAKDEKEFVTKDGVVKVTTDSATNIGSTYATLGGVINDNGMPILERGVCYGLGPDTGIDGLCMTSSDTTNTFAVALTGLENETMYYYKAYVKPLLGSVVYGEELTFTTLDGRPVVSTGNITEITATSARCSGEVTDEGHAPVLERGICWSRNASPTLDDFHITLGDGTGSFEIELTDLEVNTTYHVCAYATNALGVRYGNERTFTTKDGLPTVVTGNMSDITAISAKCSGEVTDDGGFSVTERGICWSKNANPLLENAEHIASGSGIGSFSVMLTGLEDNVTYHVRAYSVNICGTQYGEDLSFVATNNLTFTASGVDFEMIFVYGGAFLMGAQNDDANAANYDYQANSNEEPVHQVILSDFYLGKFEVTQELWIAVMGNNPSECQGDNQRPVEMVDWNTCQTFISRLNVLCANQLNGKSFTLPTEAQWEYAARGGKKSAGFIYSGSNNLRDVAWYIDNCDYNTLAVGRKIPNELGFYDMSGNVVEWCQDWYGDYNGESQTNPVGPNFGSYRVKRGGGWRTYANECRVSHRSSSNPENSYNYVGFRLSISL